MPSTTTAQVSVIAEHVGRYRQDVADIALVEQRAKRDDVVAALHEAERALRSAERALLRAGKLAADVRP